MHVSAFKKEIPVAPNTTTPCYIFDGFSVDVAARKLWHGETAVALPSRAFDVLVYLIANRERSVHKEEIITAIWNDVIVTDDSLIHAISDIRRAFKDERQNPKYIETIPRRGYRFVGVVKEKSEHEDKPATLSRLPTPVASTKPAYTETNQTDQTKTKVKLLLFVTAGIAILTMVVALQFFQGSRPLSESTTNSSIRLYQPSPEGANIVSGGILSPDNRQMAFVARDNNSGQTALWIRALHSSEPRRIEGTTDASKPFWSPDSNRVGFIANGKLLTVDIYSGELQLITNVVAAAGATWSSDDTILFAEWSKGLYTVPASGDGDVKEVVLLNREARDIAFAWPQFFPDSHRFLYQIVSLDGDRTGAYVGDLDSQQSFKLLNTTSPATFAPPNHILHVQKDMLIAEKLDLRRLQLTGHATIVARDISEPSLAAENIISASENLLSFQQGVTEQNLIWFNRDGEELSTQAVPTILYNLRLSPNGERLLASSSPINNPGLWLARLDKEEYARVNTNGVAPIWSPDGQTIAFTSRNGYELFLQKLDAESAPSKLASDNHVKILSDWSADGRYLVYITQEEGSGLDLWMMDVSSGVSHPLLVTPHSETQARISPDGNWISYASNETGRFEVYVARFPNLSDKQMVSVGGGGQPQWRADQEELFYLSLDKAIMAIQLNSNNPLAFNSPQQLFRPNVAGDPTDARDYYAVDSSGTRFLIDSAINNDHQTITVVVNWATGVDEGQSINVAKNNQ